MQKGRISLWLTIRRYDLFACTPRWVSPLSGSDSLTCHYHNTCCVVLVRCLCRQKNLFCYGWLPWWQLDQWSVYQIWVTALVVLHTWMNVGQPIALLAGYLNQWDENEAEGKKCEHAPGISFWGFSNDISQRKATWSKLLIDGVKYNIFCLWGSKKKKIQLEIRLKTLELVRLHSVHS